MDKIIQFTYSRKFAYSSTCILSFFLLVMLFRLTRLTDPKQVRIVEFFACCFFIIIIFHIVKYFIPALKGKVAMELNTNGIADHIRNTTSEWKNIQQVRLVNFKQYNTKGIAIDLKDKKTYLVNKSFWKKILAKMNDWSFGTPLIIPLQYVSGNNAQIFEAIQSYFSNKINCDR